MGKAHKNDVQEVMINDAHLKVFCFFVIFARLIFY